jgi:excisionase family DNA binding protein
MSAHKTRQVKIWRVRELAERLGVAEATIRNEVSRGKLPYARVGKLILMSDEAVERYLKGLHIE